MPLLHEGPSRPTASIELTRPVPLQAVAEGIVCGSPPELEDRQDDGLSDDGSEWALRRVSPQVTIVPFGLFPLLSRRPSTGGHLQRLREGAVLGSEASESPERNGQAPDHSTWRHDPYRPVLPAWLLSAEPDDESAISAEDVEYAQAAAQDWEEGPTVVESTSSSYEHDDWDAPRAAQSSQPTAVSVATRVPTRMIADPFANVEEELRREDESPSAPPALGEPRVMCCYFKQFGRCKMGTDCWYAHDGTAETPCHYGGICKAGHAHLVRTGNAAVPPKRTADSKRSRNFEHRERPVDSAAAHVQKPKPVGASAPMAPSNLPCAFCGDNQGVLLQEFPVYEGNARWMAFRAHCINPSCMRVYSL